MRKCQKAEQHWAVAVQSWEALPPTKMTGSVPEVCCRACLAGLAAFSWSGFPTRARTGCRKRKYTLAPVAIVEQPGEDDKDRE